MRDLKPARSPKDFPKHEDVAKWTGLEYLQKTITGEVAAPPIAGLMNFRLEAIEEGRAVFRGIPKFESANPMGTTHGGWYGAVLDSAMACAIMSKTGKGQSYTTLEYKVNIIRPVPEGMEVEAISVAGHVGRATGVADAELRGLADGKLYATASTTCMRIA
jgi:uncharacterized protein (TIGR00369 family)